MNSQQAHRSHRGWWSIGIPCCALVLTACQSRAPLADLAAEQQTIKRVSLEFSRAERSGKPDSALAFMWEDAVLQPPGHAQIQGHDAIRAFLAPTILQATPADSAPPRPDFPVHVSASGDLAVEWGPGTIMVKGADGPPTIVRFKFVTVWERRDGVWKVRLNSWNADPQPRSP